MLRGIDYAAFATSFVRRLRAAGIDTGMTHARNLVRALNETSDRETWGQRYSLTRMYWIARISRSSHPDDILAFYDVFAAVFDDSDSAQSALFHRQTPPRAQNSDLPSSVAGDSTEQGVQLPCATLPTVQSARPDAAGATWL